MGQVFAGGPAGLSDDRRPLERMLDRMGLGLTEFAHDAAHWLGGTIEKHPHAAKVGALAGGVAGVVLSQALGAAPVDVPQGVAPFLLEMAAVVGGPSLGAVAAPVAADLVERGARALTGRDAEAAPRTRSAPRQP